eukprot:2255022-Pyramimonas_sp.AAC.1
MPAASGRQSPSCQTGRRQRLLHDAASRVAVTSKQLHARHRLPQPGALLRMPTAAVIVALHLQERPAACGSP